MNKEIEYEEMYIEYYTHWNFLDSYLFGNCYGFLINDEAFSKIVTFERNLIKKYGNYNNVVSFYKMCGYDGSLDYLLLNTPYEAYLTYPKVYFDMPYSLSGSKNKIKRFTPTIHKEENLVKWIHKHKPSLNECNPIHEDGKIFLNIPGTYVGQNTFFVLKTNFTFYNFKEGKPSDIVIDYDNLEQY